MLGAFFRLLAFAALVAAGAWAVTRLLGMEGSVTVEIEGLGAPLVLTPLAAAAGLVLASAALWLTLWLAGLVWAFLRFITGDDAAFERLTERRRSRRGLDFLGRGLTALAAGDARTAQAMAARAGRMLRRPGIGRLLTAQAAELAGDPRRAERYWRALAADPETALVGVKGLMGQALAAGQSDRALRLAERAFLLRPDDAGVLETLYALQSQSFDWEGARRTLAQQRRLGTIAKEEANRRDATLALAQAEEAERDGRTGAARTLAIEAARLDPANPEAVSAAARQLGADGQKRLAGRKLVEAWKLNPAPSLARAFADLEPEESPEERRRRFQRIVEANPDHRETRFLRAELALVAGDWAGARAALEELAEPELSARSCAIRAAIARGEGEPEAVVRGWLARALGAPREEGSEAELTHAAMLPLLIGDEGAGDSARGREAGRGRAAAGSARAGAEDAAAGERAAGERAAGEGGGETGRAGAGGAPAEGAGGGAEPRTAAAGPEAEAAGPAGAARGTGGA